MNTNLRATGEVKSAPEKQSTVSEPIPSDDELAATARSAAPDNDRFRAAAYIRKIDLLDKLAADEAAKTPDRVTGLRWIADLRRAIELADVFPPGLRVFVITKPTSAVYQNRQNENITISGEIVHISICQSNGRVIVEWTWESQFPFRLGENTSFRPAFVDHLRLINYLILQDDGPINYNERELSHRSRAVLCKIAAKSRDRWLQNLVMAKVTNSSTTDGSPLISALHDSREHVLEDLNLLLKNGLDVNATDELGRTALWHAACEYPDRTDLVKLLLDWGANVNIQDKFGWSPLHNASDGLHPRKKDIASLLISHGAAVNAKTESGWTPAYLARRSGQSEILKFLISCGAK